jgi:gamma-glutamylcyclotransferase (GGCT)/AIG2-like uncharacterized protein YtfP
MRYFAYGSSLNAADLRAWCASRSLAYPLGPKIGNAWLPDHEPVFDLHSDFRGGGVLNLRPKVGQATPGALFETDPEGIGALNDKEGVPAHYRRRTVTLLLDDASSVEAETYIAAGGEEAPGHVPPGDGYLRAVREGLEEHGLPTSHIDAAARGEAPPYPIPHLFTYGTLRSGGRRHNLIRADLAGIVPARARGLVYDLGGYPGMVVDRRGGIVRGELCELKAVTATLALLDRIEGFAGFGVEGSLFRRALVRAVSREGLELTAWAYLWARAPQGDLIVSGDWTRR